MALRAGYYGLKGNIARKLQDEFEKINGIIPDGASSENPLATQSEIEDIWADISIAGAKNLNGTNYVGKSQHGITWTVNDDGTLNADGETSSTLASIADDSTYGFIAPYTGMVKLIGGVNANIVVFPYDWTDSGRPYTDSSKTTRVSGDQFGSEPQYFYMEKGHNYSIIARVKTTTTADNVTLKPAILLAEDQVEEYVPFAMTNQQLTASAADQKTAINAIIAAATGAADFAAFKAAMEAITPVTRSAAPAATREVIEDEPVTEKKTTRKKSTAAAETEKEGE